MRIEKQSPAPGLLPSETSPPAVASHCSHCRALPRSPEAEDIGPQGIVHGTALTVLNAGRKYLGSAELAGKVYVTSGLGGMSGAQAKAAVICGAVGVVAEVSGTAISVPP